MSFTSLEFPLFLIVVLIVLNWMRASSRETWLLLLVSYFFYITASLYGVLLIVFTSLLDFYVGRRVGATEDPSSRKRWLFVSLAGNLGALGFFKYTNFVLENINAGLAVFGVQLAAPPLTIALPIGISYFTFAGISYVLDVYYERMEPCRNASAYLLYIAFFPKILAGPIVRAREFLPQLAERVRPAAADLEIGVAYFLLGTVKKLVIADQLAGHVNLIFAAPGQYDAVTLLQGVIGYTVQIYCDFSGYSDMAIGCARMMGFRFPENFQMPYSAVSITEFWRRWHITLSSWFRDYVFLPLEIATKDIRNANLRMSMNLLATMALCGLWHGASWNFVVWGALHGGSLAVHRTWRSARPLSNTSDYPFRAVRILFSRVLTLAVVMIGWVFFRAESWPLAVDYLGRLLTWSGDGVRLGSPYILPLSAVIFVTHLVIGKDRNWLLEIPHWSAPVRVGAYSTAVLSLGLLGAAESTPFVYFQF